MVKVNEGNEYISLSELVKEQGTKNFRFGGILYQIGDIRESVSFNEDGEAEENKGKCYFQLQFKAEENDEVIYTVGVTGWQKGENCNVSHRAGSFDILQTLIVESGLMSFDDFEKAKYIEIERDDIITFNDCFYHAPCIVTCSMSKGTFKYPIYHIKFREKS